MEGNADFLTTIARRRTPYVMQTSNIPTKRHVRLHMAVDAEVDVTTLERYLLGLPGKPRQRERMLAKLTEHGWRVADDGRWYKTIAATMVQA